MNGFCASFSCVRGLFYFSQVNSGFFQCFLYLINADQRRIIQDRVGFHGSMVTTVDQLDPFQPFQDFFAHIESAD